MHENLDFATTLRHFRAQAAPEQYGVCLTPSGRRRRVPGLRRDELAELADVSEEHLKRLEQGRRHPSEGVVDALAKALRLHRDDHDHLRRLAGYAAVADHRGIVPREITPAARRLVDRLTEVPLGVCDATWSVLATNGSWDSYRCLRTHNLAWQTFVDPPAECGTPDDVAALRAYLAADLRASARRYGKDARLSALISALRMASADFARLWDRRPHAEPADGLRMRMPMDGGTLIMERDVFPAPGDLRLVILTEVSAGVRV